MSDVIDMSQAVNAVQRKYPDYYRNAQAHVEMCDLWGGVTCNPCGVIEASERITIELAAHPRWNACIWLAEVPDGRWLISTGCYYPSGGRSGPISIWDRRAYLDRDAALAAGIETITDFYQRMRESAHTSNGDKVLCDRLIAQLSASITKPTQMNLL